MQQTCILCNTWVPTGAACQVSRGQILSDGKGTFQGQPEGFLCYDLQACFDRRFAKVLEDSDDF